MNLNDATPTCEEMAQVSRRWVVCSLELGHDGDHHAPCGLNQSITWKTHHVYSDDAYQIEQDPTEESR